jgi:hypothetical protein
MSFSALDANSLTPKQEEAITALLNCPSIAKAAEKVGMSDRQTYRWLDEPGFSKAYRAARRQAFSHAISLTQQYAPMAVATLTKIASDQSAPHSARVSASTALLKFSRESIELDDLAERVAALEAQTRDGPGQARGGP